MQLIYRYYVCVCTSYRGKDNKEGRSPSRVHIMQIQGSAITQAMQALRTRW